MKRDEMIEYGRKHSMEPTPWIECKKVLYASYSFMFKFKNKTKYIQYSGDRKPDIFFEKKNKSPL